MENIFSNERNEKIIRKRVMNGIEINFCNESITISTSYICLKCGKPFVYPDGTTVMQDLCKCLVTDNTEVEQEKK